MTAKEFIEKIKGTLPDKLSLRFLIEMMELYADHKRALAYVVLQNTSEDYHGTYTEIVGLYANIEDARAVIKQLENDNLNYKVDYHFDTYVIK